MPRPHLLQWIILNALDVKPRTIKNLASIANRSYASIGKVLHRLVREGQVQAVGTERNGNTRNQYVYGIVNKK